MKKDAKILLLLKEFGQKISGIETNKIQTKNELINFAKGKELKESARYSIEHLITVHEITKSFFQDDYKQPWTPSLIGSKADPLMRTLSVFLKKMENLINHPVDVYISNLLASYTLDALSTRKLAQILIEELKSINSKREESSDKSLHENFIEFFKKRCLQILRCHLKAHPALDYLQADIQNDFDKFSPDDKIFLEENIDEYEQAFEEFIGSFFSLSEDAPILRGHCSVNSIISYLKSLYPLEEGEENRDINISIVTEFQNRISVITGVPIHEIRKAMPPTATKMPIFSEEESLPSPVSPSSPFSP